MACQKGRRNPRVPAKRPTKIMQFSETLHHRGVGDSSLNRGRGCRDVQKVPAFQETSRQMSLPYLTAQGHQGRDYQSFGHGLACNHLPQRASELRFIVDALLLKDLKL